LIFQIYENILQKLRFDFFNHFPNNLQLYLLFLFGCCVEVNADAIVVTGLRVRDSSGNPFIFSLKIKD